MEPVIWIISLQHNYAWLRLLNKVPNDAVSDTTDDDQSDAAGKKIKLIVKHNSFAIVYSHYNFLFIVFTNSLHGFYIGP